MKLTVVKEREKIAGNISFKFVLSDHKDCCDVTTYEFDRTIKQILRWKNTDIWAFSVCCLQNGDTQVTFPDENIKVYPTEGWENNHPAAVAGIITGTCAAIMWELQKTYNAFKQEFSVEF